MNASVLRAQSIVEYVLVFGVITLVVMFGLKTLTMRTKAHQAVAGNITDTATTTLSKALNLTN